MDWVIYQIPAVKGLPRLSLQPVQARPIRIEDCPILRRVALIGDRAGVLLRVAQAGSALTARQGKEKGIEWIWASGPLDATTALQGIL